MSGSKYSLTIHDPAGTKLADFSGMASGRRVTKSRNEADEISWKLDLDGVEHFCREANVSVSSLFSTGRNEVRIRRGTTCLAAGQLIYWNASSNAQGKSLDLRALGYFDLLGSRYTSEEFAAKDGTQIAWELIDNSQNQPNGDFGIRRGNIATTGLWNKTYARISLKEAIQELAESPTKGFDFEVDWQKLFHTYNSIGADVSKTVRFEAPGNILEWQLPNDATGLANEVIGIGSGNGEQAQSTYTGNADNSPTAAASQLNYALRQKFLQRSSTDNEDGTLTDAVRGEIETWAFPFEVPSIVVDANREPFVTSYGIGDRVRVKLSNSDLAGHIDGSYRIERLELNISETDDERVTLGLSS